MSKQAISKKQCLAACDQSLEHWKEILAYTRKRIKERKTPYHLTISDYGGKIGPNECALCITFSSRNVLADCTANKKECPIFSLEKEGDAELTWGCGIGSTYGNFYNAPSITRINNMIGLIKKAKLYAVKNWKEGK